MALTYSQLVTASADPTFRGRVLASVEAASIAIAQDAPSLAIDIRRDTFARQILSSPDVWGVVFALPVALGFGAKSNVTLTDATDAELDTRVSSIFNKMMRT
jgi:hypothetical protein